MELAVQIGTLVVTLIWLGVTYQVLIANRDAVVEARKANEDARKAYSKQSLLDSYPALYLGAREDDNGEALVLDVYSVGSRPATHLEALVFSHTDETWMPPDADELVYNDKYEVVSSFQIPVVLPGRRYAVRVKVGGRSEEKIVLVQFSDALGNSYVERYDFGEAPWNRDSDQLPLTEKQPKAPRPVPRWRIEGDFDPSGSTKTELVVDPNIGDDVIPVPLREAVASTTAFALSWSGVWSEIEDVPNRA